MPTGKLIFELYRKRYYFADPGPLPQNPSDVNFDFGTHVYSTWTEVGIPVLVQKKDIPQNHFFTQKFIQSHFNGFSQQEIRNVGRDLIRFGFPRCLISEIINAFALYNSCIRDPYLFDLFTELFPFTNTFYYG